MARSDCESDGHHQPRDATPRSSCRINPTADDRITCPIHHTPGVEKKQKWFCPVCGMLLQTCCD